MSSPPTISTIADSTVDAQATSKDPSVVEQAPSQDHDPAQHPLAQLSNVRKHVLLAIFSVANFVDVCNISGVGVAVAQIAGDINLQVSQIVWILTAYSLTFASFLLFAGRLSDLYPAQYVFVGGFVVLGVLSLVVSFVTTSKYGFLILRALGGIAGAMTIPSAYHLLVHMFPDPEIKRKKLAIIGLSAAFGNVLGLVLGALCMLASYHWFFRLMAILCLSFSGLTLLVLPMKNPPSTESRLSRLRRLDVVGVFIMSSALLCFLLALTQGPIDGWSSASFIAPIVIFVVLAPLFFVWETRIHPRKAILPATVWKIKNMIIASIAVMFPFAFWVTSQVLFSTYWQVSMGWRPLHVAAAALPQGITALLAGGITQMSPIVIGNPRRSVPIGAGLAMIGLILMYFSDGGRGLDYWRFCFPGFVIGSAGAITMFMGAGINLIMHCPPEMGGVAGAWNQTMAQIGGAICLAVQAGLEEKTLRNWRPNARSFWFEVAVFGAAAIVYFVGYSEPESPEKEHELARERMKVVEQRWEKADE